MILLFYYLALQQNDELVTSLCMQLHLSGERGKYHCDESALHYLCPKRKVLKQVKGHQPLDEEWTLILMRVLSANKKTSTKMQLHPICFTIIFWSGHYANTYLSDLIFSLRPNWQFWALLYATLGQSDCTLSRCSTHCRENFNKSYQIFNFELQQMI